MKISESWLREWVNPKASREELCSILTMGGLEVDELAPVAANMKNILIGEVVAIEKHPEADRLNICKVNIGKTSLLNIVCGASNVAVNMKAPVAIIDAVLPNQTKITAATIRGIPSEGMLCSASELGLAEESNGLLELPTDAPIGEALTDYLALDDYIIEVSITPNRGDCLSIKGMARDVAALTNTKPKQIKIPKVKAKTKNKLSINIEAKAECPHYVGRIINNVQADLISPLWLKERLRRSGIRSISPIVDVTNYVMLELGQPMHAFDLDTISKGIKVRLSKKGESIALLDDTTKKLNNDTLVIADHEKPLAIAGVMGGIDSSVTTNTKNILLESAYFAPNVVAKQRQHYQLNSDSAYRFERGVDHNIQLDAIERATQLILAIAGGEAGPVIEVTNKSHLPKEASINLSAEKMANVLGITIPSKTVENILTSLGFIWKSDKKSWKIKVPSYRSDVTIPEDIIEEIARIYGYDNIPTHVPAVKMQANIEQLEANNLQPYRESLRDQGYHEIISYSFVSKKMQEILDPGQEARSLLNPITADMDVMRTNLWAGLINTYAYNKARQQHRIRLFEIGTCFITNGKNLHQEQRIAGLISGLALPEQWGIVSREADFFDAKGDLENLLSLIGDKNQLTFKADTHAALNPGQTASIYLDDQKLGTMGALHPSVLQALDIKEKLFVFELDANLLKKPDSAQISDISKFPEIRRDIAIMVNQTIRAKDIQDTIKLIAGDWLKDVFIFDVYQGKGIAPGLKSIALGLVLQHPTRTLVDDEVAALMERVISALKGHLGAELRS